MLRPVPRDDWDSLAGDAQLGNLADGARAAYMDYQGLRVADRAPPSPPSFHYNFTYGHTAVFVLDIRSERRVGGAGEGNTLYGPEQFAELERFLAEQADKKLVLLVTSVPVIYLPGYLADIGDKATGWDGRVPPCGGSGSYFAACDGDTEATCRIVFRKWEHQGCH